VEIEPTSYNIYNRKMPRRYGGSRRSSFGRRARSPSPPTRSAATSSRPFTQSQSHQQQKPGFFSGLGSTIMHGMAFGSGSEFAHQAVRSVAGGNTPEQQVQQQQGAPQQQTNPNPCQQEMFNFGKCLEQTDNIADCQKFADQLKFCRTNNNLA
jgi:hypothetical protein